MGLGATDLPRTPRHFGVGEDGFEPLEPFLEIEPEMPGVVDKRLRLDQKRQFITYAGNAAVEVLELRSAADDAEVLAEPVAVKQVAFDFPVFFERKILSVGVATLDAQIELVPSAREARASLGVVRGGFGLTVKLNMVMQMMVVLLPVLKLGRGLVA